MNRLHFTLADSPVLVGAIPPWLPRFLVAKRVGMVGANPPWLPQLLVAKRVGTEARPLPNVESSKVECTQPMFTSQAVVRHQQKIDEIAQKLQEQGYEVILEPEVSLLPFDLGSYRPDILAFGQQGGVIVEVKGEAQNFSVDRLHTGLKPSLGLNLARTAPFFAISLSGCHLRGRSAQTTLAAQFSHPQLGSKHSCH